MLAGGYESFEVYYYFDAVCVYVDALVGVGSLHENHFLVPDTLLAVILVGSLNLAVFNVRSGNAEVGVFHEIVQAAFALDESAAGLDFKEFAFVVVVGWALEAFVVF